jgi:serine/threonine-protein kinase HipA
MNRTAKVWMYNQYAGVLVETDTGYSFAYNTEYLEWKDAKPISFSFPLQKNEFVSNVLFAFFDGLIPEGWLLAIVEKNWKINEKDRMGILMVCCQDCIGAVSISIE